AVGDHDARVAQALYLRADELDARLDALVNVEVVRRLAIGGDHFDDFGFGRAHYHSPTFCIDDQGSLAGSALPFCSSSTEIRSGDRTNAMRPSRGGRESV